MDLMDLMGFLGRTSVANFNINLLRGCKNTSSLRLVLFSIEPFRNLRTHMICDSLFLLPVNIKLTIYGDLAIYNVTLNFLLRILARPRPTWPACLTSPLLRKLRSDFDSSVSPQKALFSFRVVCTHLSSTLELVSFDSLLIIVTTLRVLVMKEKLRHLKLYQTH